MKRKKTLDVSHGAIAIMIVIGAAIQSVIVAILNVMRGNGL